MLSFHLPYQILVSRASGRDDGLEGYRVADDTRRESNVRLDLLAGLVYAFGDIEDSQRPDDGEPYRRICKLLPGANTPSVAENMLPWIRGRIGSQKAGGIESFRVRIHSWVVSEPPVSIVEVSVSAGKAATIYNTWGKNKGGDYGNIRDTDQILGRMMAPLGIR